MRKKLKLFSLFSGAGGLDLGFILSDAFESFLANDILKIAAETFAYNFHHKIMNVEDFNSDIKLPVYIVGDVSKIMFDLLKKEEPDVIIAGPPCQDFSIVRGPANERKGLLVIRGRLYSHFIRALIYLQPKFFVFENVPGLKSANNGRAYKMILEDLSNLNIRWNEIKSVMGNNYKNKIKNYVIIFHDIVDAAWIGAPQRRRRLIIIGIREDLLGKDWFEKRNILENEAENIIFGNSSLFRKYPLTPIECFEGKILSDLNQEYKAIMEEYHDLSDFAHSEKVIEWKEKIWRKCTFNILEDYFRANSIRPVSNSEIDKALKEHEDILKLLGYYQSKLEGKQFEDNTNLIQFENKNVLDRMRMIPPDGNCDYVRNTKWHVEGNGLSLIYRRLHPLKPSYTIVAYGGGGTWGYHYKRDRGKLTNRERARLQTFPDNYVFKGNVQEIRAQIGEAVPPLLGERIARIILNIIDIIKWKI